MAKKTDNPSASLGVWREYKIGRINKSTAWVKFLQLIYIEKKRKFDLSH
jgi:hypothetical protein